MTDGFKVGTGLKQGVGPAPSLFNIALEYVVRQLSVQTASTILHKSVQLDMQTIQTSWVEQRGLFQVYMVN